MLHLQVYRPGQGVFVLHSIEEAQEALRGPGNVLWVDMEGRSAETDAVLEQVFGFHELAIEDVYKSQHRPKIEDYDQYLYVIAQGLADEASRDLGDVQTLELDLFLGENFVVTHHPHRMSSIEATRAAVLRDPTIMERGAPFLAHAILDRLVDRFLPLREAYEDAIERLEDQVLERAAEADLERILSLLRGLQHLRRMGVTQRAVLGRLAARTFDELPEEVQPFFRDVHEHFAQFMEDLDAHREALQQLFNAFHSLSAHRMNEIMKVLTLISTIMLPLTFIAGVYGMNFDNMPELHWEYGYFMVWGLMVLLSATMVGYFRWRRWL